MKERIAESECKTVIKKNSVLLVETLITGSPELLQPMRHDEMLAYMKRAYDFMAERVGEQNIVSAVIHLDEKTPHMHLCFVPLSEDKRLTAKVDRESSKVFDLTLENKRVNREIEKYKTDVYLLERQVERYKKLVEKIPPEIMSQIKGSRKRDDDFGDRYGGYCYEEQGLQNNSHHHPRNR